eukprot:g1129.t1
MRPSCTWTQRVLATLQIMTNLPKLRLHLPISRGRKKRFGKAWTRSTFACDGNGQVNWPEFVEWAEVNHVDLKLGLSGGEDAVSQFDITDTDHFMELDQLLQKSYKKVWTRDRKKTGVDKVPLGFELVKAKRCENLKDWKRYYFRRHQIAGACSKETKFLQRPVLTSQAAALYTRQGMRKHLNEWLLFHGTSPEAAQSILSGSGDFVISLAGSATGTLYGRGTYFAESITKASPVPCPALLCIVIWP